MRPAFGVETPAVVRSLEDAAATLRAGGFSPETVIRPGEPEKVLAAMTADSGGAPGSDAGHDLLVMGAYGHSRVRTLLIGSTTTEMIRSCKVPVILMR